MATTPAATKIALIATLALSVATDADYVRRAPRAEIEPAFTAWYLLFLGLLFVVRVVGQRVVVRASPSWLPPMQEWNRLPYRLLLPVQLVFVVVIAAIVSDFLAGPWLFAKPNEGFGRVAVVFSFVYAGSMVVRYVVQMTRRQEARWFGGTIPMVFHIVLASFVFILGTYHASY